jgi:hypothetical protein
MEKGSVRGALRPGVVVGAKCCGGRKWLRKEPNVIAPRREKRRHYSFVVRDVKVFTDRPGRTTLICLVTPFIAEFKWSRK